MRRFGANQNGITTSVASRSSVQHALIAPGICAESARRHLLRSIAPTGFRSARGVPGSRRVLQSRRALSHIKAMLFLTFSCRRSRGAPGRHLATAGLNGKSPA